MTIEKYNPIDKFECIKVFESNMPQFFLEQELTDFQNWIGQNDCPDFYVLKKDETIIGFGGFYLELKKARLVYGVIDRRYQNKGHGTRLLDYRIQQIKEKDKDLAIGLEATALNYKFFEKLGFKIIEIVPYYYYSTIDKYDMILHTYPLKKKKTKKRAKKT